MWRASSGGKGARRRPGAPAGCCRRRRPSRRRLRSSVLRHLLLVLAAVCAAAAAAAGGAGPGLIGGVAAPPPARGMPTPPPAVGEQPPAGRGRRPWRAAAHGAPAENVSVIAKSRRGPVPKSPRRDSAARSQNVPPATWTPSDTTAVPPSAAKTPQNSSPEGVAGQAGGVGVKGSGAVSEDVVRPGERAGDTQVVPDGHVISAAEIAAPSPPSSSPPSSSPPSSSPPAALDPPGTSSEPSTIATTATTVSGSAPDAQKETSPATTDNPAPRETAPPKLPDVDVTYSCAAVSECEPCALSATEEECKATGYRQMVECRPMIQQDDGTISTFPNPMSPPVFKEWRSCTLDKNAETVRFFVFQVINLIVAAASTFSVIHRRRQLNEYQYALLSRRINNA